MITQKSNFFFIGIAGSGMSAIAAYLSNAGKNISGSDRIFYGKNRNLKKDKLEKIGIKCFQQDGSGINKNTEIVVISTAVEKSNIEYKKAKALNLMIVHRADLLADIVKSKKTIAVSGTSGKSTTTAMIFHILQSLNMKPSLITGAEIIDIRDKTLIGNSCYGNGEYLIIEADESDGTLVKYKPELGIILNIEKDHKEITELNKIFGFFAKNCKNLIVNLSNKNSHKFSQNSLFDFSINTKSNFYADRFSQEGFSASFFINNNSVNIKCVGRHNMENATAAISAACAIGCNLEDACNAMKSFKGINRRHELIYSDNNISIIDDYAHNPTKIAASINACKGLSDRIIAWFQPHGFGPLNFFKEELCAELFNTLRINDIFVISDIYYAGGTANKNISANDIIDILKEKYNMNNVYYVENRNDIISKLKENIIPSTTILLMGARDSSLSDFAKYVSKSLVEQ